MFQLKRNSIWNEESVLVEKLRVLIQMDRFAIAKTNLKFQTKAFYKVFSNDLSWVLRFIFRNFIAENLKNWKVKV